MKWRVGTKVGRNVYRDNVLYTSFPVDGEAAALAFVDMMNAKESRKPEPRKVWILIPGRGPAELYPTSAGNSTQCIEGSARELTLDDALVEKLERAFWNGYERWDKDRKPAIRAILDHLFGDPK